MDSQCSMSIMTPEIVVIHCRSVCVREERLRSDFKFSLCDFDASEHLLIIRICSQTTVALRGWEVMT